MIAWKHLRQFEINYYTKKNFIEIFNNMNPHWARVEAYVPFFLCVIYKEGLCPSSGDINRPMMMMMMIN
jgi:hypothetical protein